MRKILILLFFYSSIAFSSYAKTLEYQYNFWGSDFLFIDGEKTIEEYIFNPWWGYINNNLKDILKESPECFKLLKIAHGLTISGSVFLGIGIGCLVGPILSFPLSLYQYHDQYGTYDGYTPTDYLAILGFVTSGISITSIIYGIISEIVYPKIIKKSFDLYNKQNEDSTDNTTVSLFFDTRITDCQLGINLKF